ncbi:hypothetical protein ACH5RR_012905 [Cinchona calisaya]|uniref:Uncharacterized protein n=1 Tax=Cinchona calisaya TaxID=153742 RepID=A0ABD3A964_9GENT
MGNDIQRQSNTNSIPNSNFQKKVHNEPSKQIEGQNSSPNHQQIWLPKTIPKLGRDGPSKLSTVEKTMIPQAGTWIAAMTQQQAVVHSLHEKPMHDEAMLDQPSSNVEAMPSSLEQPSQQVRRQVCEPICDDQHQLFLVKRNSKLPIQKKDIIDTMSDSKEVSR